MTSYIHDKESERSLERNKARFDLSHQALKNNQVKTFIFLFSPCLVMWWENKSSSPCTGQTQVEKRTHWHPMEPREQLTSALPSAHTGIQTEASQTPSSPVPGTLRNFSGFTKAAKRRWKFFSDNSAWHSSNYWLYLGILLYFALKASLLWEFPCNI